ncbi:MAG: lipid 3-O-deacylase [Rhodospirillales bacterium]|jgi:lipid A 3-O-deacylase|nr:lipid 3-O-deacylase [Rhodospirillales bacterium]
MHPRVVVALFALLAAPPALAESASSGLARDIVDHASIGYLAHDVSGLWSGFRIERAATALNFDVVFAPHLDVLWGTIRPAVGGTVTLGDGTSYGYADARYEITGPFATFFGVGLGFAVHDGAFDRTRFVPPGGHDDKALGSRVLFHVPLEVGVTVAERVRLSAYFEHVSNGWLGTDVNEGMDNVGARIGYKF